MARRVLIDLSPLRSSPDFRRLFLGQTVSMVGSQGAAVAIAFQVYALTGSPLQVGAVSFVQLVPFVLGALAGGVLGVEHRRAMAGASTLLALLSGGLALNALGGRSAPVAVIYVLVAVAAALTGVLSTAVSAVVPSLVAAGQLTPAYATLQVVDQLGMVVGPLVSGVLIAALGLPWLYGIDALTFLWAASFLWRMTLPTPASQVPASQVPASQVSASQATQPNAGYGASARPLAGRLRALADGWRYLRNGPEFSGASLLDLCATVFGLPRALFPALAQTVFHGGAGVLGLLSAAPAAGALLGSLTSGWLTGVRRQGSTVITAVAAWGVLVIAFGFAHVLWVALVLLVLAGWVDLISAILRSTIIQSAVDEKFRSRVSSLQMAVVEGGPRLGDLESGAVASAVSTQFAIVSGGIVCVLGALVVAAVLPGFRRYRWTPGGGRRSEWALVGDPDQSAGGAASGANTSPLASIGVPAPRCGRPARSETSVAAATMISS